MAAKLPLLADDDLEEMVEASLMLEDPRFFLDNWEQGETVRAVSQWEDVSYQVFSDDLFDTRPKRQFVQGYDLLVQVGVLLV